MAEPDWKAMALKLAQEAERTGVSLYREGMRVWRDCGPFPDRVIRLGGFDVRLGLFLYSEGYVDHAESLLGPDLSHEPTALLVARGMRDWHDQVHWSLIGWRVTGRSDLSVGFDGTTFTAESAGLGEAVHEVAMAVLRALPDAEAT